MKSKTITVILTLMSAAALNAGSPDSEGLWYDERSATSSLYQTHKYDYKHYYNSVGFCLTEPAAVSKPTDIRLKEYSQGGSDPALKAWGSNFTTNINVQTNYWPVVMRNLSECNFRVSTVMAGSGGWWRAFLPTEAGKEYKIKISG